MTGPALMRQDGILAPFHGGAEPAFFGGGNLGFLPRHESFTARNPVEIFGDLHGGRCFHWEHGSTSPVRLRRTFQMNRELYRELEPDGCPGYPAPASTMPS